jgi:hypothetical protein
MLGELTGKMGPGVMSKMISDFEVEMTKAAKSLFKNFGLTHWKESTKVGLFLVMTLVPIFIVLIIGTLKFIFIIFNF